MNEKRIACKKKQEMLKRSGYPRYSQIKKKNTHEKNSPSSGF